MTPTVQHVTIDLTNIPFNSTIQSSTHTQQLPQHKDDHNEPITVMQAVQSLAVPFTVNQCTQPTHTPP